MVTIEPPRKRQCERCGRVETWDEESGTWVGAGGDAERGDPHCVHEWDITGSYNPLGNTL
jgi:hypothetical protein